MVKLGAIRFEGERLFEAALVLSLIAHLGVGLFLARWTKPSATDEFPILEVDLRTPFRPRLPGDTRLPGKAKGAPAPDTFKPDPLAAPTPVPVMPLKPTPPPEEIAGTAPMPSEKPREWVVPGPNTQVLLKPTLPPAGPPAPTPAVTAPGGTGPGGQGGPGGSGGGPGTGDAWVNRPPRLLNLAEVRASLRKFYPEVERRAGREGSVVVRIGISAEGKVTGVEVLQSDGEAFDEGAKSVARMMRFEPALKESRPIAVTVRQSVGFKLTE